MFNRISPYPIKTPRRRVVTLWNRVVLGSSGAVSSQDSEKDAGFVITKTGSETGRYTVTLSGGKAKKLLKAHVTIIGADDTAYTDAKGIGVIARDDDIASDGTVELQLTANTNNADAEAVDSVTLQFELSIQLV